MAFMRPGQQQRNKASKTQTNGTRPIAAKTGRGKVQTSTPIPLYKTGPASCDHRSPPPAYQPYYDPYPVSRQEWTEAWQCEQSWHRGGFARPWEIAAVHRQSAITQTMNQGGAFVDRVGARLSDMLSRSGDDDFTQDEMDALARGLESEDQMDVAGPPLPEPLNKAKQKDSKEKSFGVVNFKKSWLYKNSRLPPHLLPFTAYVSTWTLVCRAAQSSMDVYQRPRRDQREFYTDADPKLGTKATIIKSQPIDDRQFIIVAIRGSQYNFVDWAVNFRPAPTQPTGFLDDEGNACHAGFLQVAISMVRPVAAQLRNMIEHDPSLATSSLLFTGHSAGGAVASLLYAHMLSTRVRSELTSISGFFKRIHCITFGAPPVTLLPLRKPRSQDNNKFVFLAFVNEGDPVVRADKQYVISLAKLIGTPAPTANNGINKLRQKISMQVLRNANTSSAQPPHWPVPDATLSNAGRMVLLREKSNSKFVTTEARQITDGELRDVIFGDPSMHRMMLYKLRVEEVAFAAISGRER
ncbi:Hypothetical protein R9X50_00295300 [Acrodontium crateriforme]|uniref:Fungal lipase-type domain-containing protein n=1 Tax=Acrodontium crateriforme TaxID=150365 RepID=A0AAQ3M2C4_9PEZI|nr:Hypothetical protein R9X50_00295300 [Acrodontium crateriforme]